MVRTVSAGVAAASVVPLLAVGAREAGRAATAVPAGDVLNTRSSVKTRPVCALHGADLTVCPVEALRARTGITVLHILEERREEKQNEEMRK